VGQKEFINLHCHTTFSFRDAYGQPIQHATRAAELGHRALAITDHGSISGWVRHQKACRELGVKPLFGCEFYMVSSLQAEAESRKKRDHLTVIAQNEKGLQNIMALLSLAWENFYYKPIIDYATLLRYSEGLVILSGCMFGRYAQTVWSREDDKKAESIAKKFAREFPGRFFLEVQAFDIDACRTTAEAAVSQGSRLGIPVLVTNDAHYPGPEDARARELLLRVTPGWTPDTIDSPLWQHSRAEQFHRMREVWKGVPKATISELMDNTILVADLCEDISLPQAEPVHYMPVECETVENEFLEWCKRGWKRRGLNALPPDKKKVYKERLKYETGLIQNKHFEDYLMVVADVIMWAKSQGIVVGPARGSSCGSLVCWLLGITEVDPIRWNLLFERFIDLNRMDPPDIDTDFEDARRDEVHEYLRQKYGEDRFAQLCTFAQYKPKNALDDVARAYRIPRDPVETLKGFIIERSSADARASHCLEDTITSFPAAQEVVDKYPDLKKAIMLEGQFRQTGRHACGVIIGEKPLNQHTALIRSEDGRPMVCYEGYDSLALGFLKLDVLGLRSLTIIATILNKIGKDIEWLYALPTDDEETYHGFQRGDLTGIFQFTGQSTTSVCKQMPPTHFMELADISALSRPGPLHSGSTTIYISRRNGESEVDWIHPIYKEITKDTWGVIVYQEQIMEIGRHLAGMDWETVSVIRKSISKKLGVEGFRKLEKIFVEGCWETNGVDRAVSKEIWDNICTHGSWSFNKSHAVAYSLISYMMMYLKVHYPIEFQWANLVDLTDQQKKMYILRDFINAGGKVLPVTINDSEYTWKIDGDGLRPGLLEIKGIGPKIAEEIIEHQPYTDMDDLIARTNGRRVHSGIRKLIEECDLFGEGEKDVWGLTKMKEILDDLPITHRIADLGWGKEHFCIAAGRIIEKNTRDIFEIAWSKRGEILDPKTVYKPELASYINITLEDDTDSIYATFDRFIYPHVRDIITNVENQSDDIFMLKGEKTKGFRKIYAKSIVNVSLQRRKEMEEQHGSDS